MQSQSVQTHVVSELTELVSKIMLLSVGESTAERELKRAAVCIPTSHELSLFPCYEKTLHLVDSAFNLASSAFAAAAHNGTNVDVG